MIPVGEKLKKSKADLDSSKIIAFWCFVPRLVAPVTGMDCVTMNPVLLTLSFPLMYAIPGLPKTPRFSIVQGNCACTAESRKCM